MQVGDFGILVRSGFSVSKALFFNFLSALVALAGTALVGVLRFLTLLKHLISYSFQVCHQSKILHTFVGFASWPRSRTVISYWGKSCDHSQFCNLAEILPCLYIHFVPSAGVHSWWIHLYLGSWCSSWDEQQREPWSKKYCNPIDFTYFRNGCCPLDFSCRMKILPLTINCKKKMNKCYFCLFTNEFLRFEVVNRSLVEDWHRCVSWSC